MHILVYTYRCVMHTYKYKHKMNPPNLMCMIMTGMQI